MTEPVNDATEMKATAKAILALVEQMVPLADRGALLPAGTPAAAADAARNWTELAQKLTHTAEGIQLLAEQATLKAKELELWGNAITSLGDTNA